MNAVLRKGRLLLRVVALALPLAGAAHGALAATPASPIQALEALPPNLGPFARFGEITNFESHPGGAGLGAAVEFREPASGAIGTVYVYARGQTGLPGGTASPAVERELTMAGEEIDLAGRTRHYTVSERGRAADVHSVTGQPALRCDSYVIAFQSGSVTDSYACMGVLNGRFLKLRVSVPRRSASAPEPLLSGFARSVLVAMDGRPRK